MALPDLQNYVAGETPITADDMNTLRRAVALLNRFAADLGLTDDLTITQRRRSVLNETVLARLGAVLGEGVDWTEVGPTVGGSFDDIPGGLTGAVQGEALQYNGAIITLRRARDPNTGEIVWVILDVGLPQYAGMVLAAPAQNQRGWMFTPIVEALT
jgi:hypothetical protein